VADIIGLKLTTLQTAIETRLHDDAWFEHIPILTQKYKDVPFLYAESVAKLGMVAVVSTPIMDNIRPNEPEVIAEYIPISIIISENTLFNTTGKKALDTAQVTLSLLHNYPLPGCYTNWDGESVPVFSLHARRPTITLVVEEDEPTILTYMVNLNTYGCWVYDGEALTTTTEQILTEAGIPITTEGDEIITTQ
jgi:hypothetical protein